MKIVYLILTNTNTNTERRTLLTYSTCPMIKIPNIFATIIFMSYINTNSPFGEPLFGSKAGETISFFKNNGAEVKHPLHQVDSGLPKSLGDALGDLDPQHVNRAILALIYTMRSLETVKSTAKAWFDALRNAATQLSAKLKSTEEPKNHEFVPFHINDTNIHDFSKTQLFEIHNQKPFQALKLIVNQLIDDYTKDINLVSYEEVEINDENARFIERLNKIGIDNICQLPRAEARGLQGGNSVLSP